MRLTHPGELAALGQLHGIAPERFEILAENAGERFGVHRAALLDDVHCLALVPCLAQVRDEVVVVGMPDERGEHPAAEALVGVLAQEILREQQLVHRGGRFDEIAGDVRIKERLRAVAQPEVSGVAELVRDREHVRHAVVPAEQNVGIAAVGRGAEAARLLADVAGKVDPALIVRLIHHVGVVLSENGERAADVFARFLDRDVRVKLRVERQLEIGKSHAVELVHLPDEAGVLAHRGRELFGDEVDLPVVHLARDVVGEEVGFKHVGKAALVGHNALLREIGVVGGGGRVLVLPELIGERAERRAAHVRVGLVLILVLEERVAERVFPAVHGEGAEFHVGELRHVVNVVGRVEYRTECGEDLFGLGAEAVRLLAEDLRKIMLRALGLVHGGTDELFGRVGDLTLDEREAASDLGGERGHLRVLLLRLGIGIVYGNGETRVARRLVEQDLQLLIERKTFGDALRRGESVFVRFLQRVGKRLCFFDRRLKIGFRCENQGEIPCLVDRYVFSGVELQVRVLLTAF